MNKKVFEFGPFELDTAQQELRRRGARLKMPGSRLRLLFLFVTRHGGLVTREEIAACLWKETQNVDVMSGINTAVNQLRAQLGDDPAAPAYIETVIGTGYRFIAKVSEIDVPAIPEPPDPNPPILEAPDPLPAIALEAPLLTATEAPAEPPASPRTHRKAFLVALVVLLAASLAYLLLHAAASRRKTPLTGLELARVTGTGDIAFADISPDGKYVAYVRQTGGEQSIWLKQLATGRLLLLAAIGNYQCPGLAFAPDGSFVYFVRKESLEPTGELYRVPFLGGTPVKVLSGISGEPAIAPDGNSVAFIKSTLVTHGEDSVVTASIDGSDVHVLATYKAPGIHFNRIAWMADGATLVFPLQSHLMAIPARGGAARPLTPDHWRNIDDLARLPSGNDLMVVGEISGSALPQVYQVSPGGEVRTITHDLSNYTSVRATADGKTLIAVQDLSLASIQLLTPGAGAEATSLNGENQNREGAVGLAWTPEGKIFYSSGSGPQVELMEMDSDGANPRRLAGAEGDADVYSNPSVSARGDFVAVASWFDNDEANIWRIDAAGNGRERLTAGRQDFPPSITPDDKWVVYASVLGDESVLMKVPSHGGSPKQLTDYSADSPSVSPDGKWIACSYIPQQSQSPRLALVPIDGGPPARVFQLPETAMDTPFQWTPDGRAVTFINNVNGAGNIWQQPVNGDPATAVTHFTAGKIFNFAWSRNGRLALSRGTETIDAVLIQNFREPSH